MKKELPKLIYLACPYNAPSAQVRERRFRTISSVAAALFKQGFHVFSPISHSHPIALNNMGASFDEWREFDLRMLRRCDIFAFCPLTGWEDSIGLKVEWKEAIKLQLPVLSCSLYGELTQPTAEELAILSS